jgi:tartrate dehydratase alpha subunit/fumarate hydratase class I-like protein
MTVIRQEDFIASVAGALQYISYYHPVDYITSLTKAYEREQSHAAKDAIAQILINSRMCAERLCEVGHGRSLRVRFRRAVDGPAANG